MILKELKDYVVLDFETTGEKGQRIIEVGAIKIEKNEPVKDVFYTRVNPEGDKISFFATQKHGIKESDLIDSPKMNEVLPELLSYIGSSIIVGYSNSMFDIRCLNMACLREGRPFITNKYFDVSYCYSFRKKNSLETISNELGFDTSEAHNALADCKLTFYCLKVAQQSIPDLEIYLQDTEGEVFNSKSKKKKETAKDDNKNALHNLLDKLIDIKDNGYLNSADINWLEEWMNKYIPECNEKNDFVMTLSDSLIQIIQLEDYDEVESISGIINDYLDCPSMVFPHDKIESIEGKTVLLTGDFEFGKKDAVCAFIKQYGGIAKESGYNNDVDIVVVGLKNHWFDIHKFSTSVIKAYKSSKETIIVSEDDFISEINNRR